MGEMKIRVDAKVEGKACDFTFEWEGDDDEIQNVMEFIDRVADAAKVTPEAFTHSALHHLPNTGVLEDPGQKQAQMMAILYTVLQLPTGQPDRPGSIYNYAASESIDVTLTVRDEGVNVSISGKIIPD